MGNLRMCLVGLMAGAMICDPVVLIKPARADTPALFFDTHKTRLPHADCIRDARRTMQAVGARLFTNQDFVIGGTIGNANALIFCTFIPRSGPCGTDGAVVTIVSASPAGPEADTVLKRLQTTFGNGTLIDCG